MATLSAILSVAEPTGVWQTIIKAFEAGVGSYILAVVLITLIIRLIWAPLDTINKKLNKKNARIQAKMQPELEKIKAKYGADKNLLNRKTQEVYKRYNFSMTGSCLFMILFLALNLLIFFSLFAGLNSMADYKISQEYDYLKYNYANVLNLTDQQYNANNTAFFEQYETLTFEVIDNQIVAKNAEGEIIAQTEYKTDFSYTTDEDQVDGEGNVILDENGQPLKVVVSSDEAIYDLVTKFVSHQPQTNENGEVVTGENGETIYEERYVGDEILIGEVTYKQVIDSYVTRYIVTCYENRPEKSSFLWIENYWIADSPFKNSIFTYDEFVGEIGSNNVSEYEQVIYNSFMSNLDAQVGRVNGYLILAILSVGISFLSIFLGNLTGKKKGEKIKQPTGGKVMMIVLPIIMGIFAIFYNSVFAIYLVVGQAINAALAPLENLIINKWDEHDEKKQQEKQNSVVSYRRK